MMNGGDKYRLQKILGHRSGVMVERYAHLAPEIYAEDHDRLGNEAEYASSVIELRPNKRRSSSGS